MAARGTWLLVAVLAMTAVAMVVAEEEEREEEPQWRFLYGEDMAPSYWAQRAVRPLDVRRAVLVPPGDYADECGTDTGPARKEGSERATRAAYRLGFAGGIPYVEPGVATIYETQVEKDEVPTGPFEAESQGGDVHGVAVLLTKRDSQMLDRTGGFQRFSSKSHIERVMLRTYAADVPEGVLDASLKANVVFRDHAVHARPSFRHLQALLDAAEEAGIEELYMSRALLTQKYYDAGKLIVDRRKASMKAPRELPKISVEELAQHDGQDPELPVYTSVMGYVLQARPIFSAWYGRDITNSNLRFFRGEMLTAANLDDGLSPYPQLHKLSLHEQEYLQHNLDSILSMQKTELVGVLEEFWEEQEDGIYYDINELDYLHNLYNDAPEDVLL